MLHSIRQKFAQHLPSSAIKDLKILYDFDFKINDSSSLFEKNISEAIGFTDGNQMQDDIHGVIDLVLI